jgi:hypothetical protein
VKSQNEEINNLKSLLKEIETMKMKEIDALKEELAELKKWRIAVTPLLVVIIAFVSFRYSSSEEINTTLQSESSINSNYNNN